tara:strand:- start:27 stop:770 length:744 start_codon:yes stop_codon:yes gene_type:complete
MDYIITCISHNRHENVESFIEKVGTNEIIFFVKDQKDKELYLENGAKKVIISGSLMDSRNSSLEYCFSLNKICIQLSDDLEKIMLNDFTGKRTHKYVSVLNVLEDLITKFKSSKYHFAGFPPTNNPFFALKEEELNKFIVGDFIIIKPNFLRFDNNLRLKEDYDYTLQHIKELGGCIRYGKYLNSFKHYSNKGGAVDYRNSELEQKTIKYLISKWGNCIKLNQKRENEILLNRKSFDILNSNQALLF